MTTFEPVNVGLGLSDYSTEATTPTTPRAPMTNPSRPAPLPCAEDSTRSAPNTPTTLNFGGVNGQRPLPSSPFNNSFQIQHQPLGTTRPGIISRGDSSRSIQSIESQDIDMDESDEGDGGSDAESIDLETGRPSKKKKGQRFFCTEFPPCKLSFTRSEHLARHIRYGLGSIGVDHFPLTVAGNIPGSDLSNVTAHVDSLVLTTCVSMPRQYMSMRKYLVTLSLLLVLVFKGKFGLIV